MKGRVFIVVLAALLPVPAFAQDAGDAGGATIVIEEVGGDESAGAQDTQESTTWKPQRTVWKTGEKEVDPAWAAQHAMVQDSLAASGRLVHSLKNTAKSRKDVTEKWQEATQHQSAARIAFGAGKHAEAMSLTLDARKLARAGHKLAGSTLSADIEDTDAERTLAAKADKKLADAFLANEKRALSNEELNPRKRVDQYRRKPTWSPKRWKKE